MTCKDPIVEAVREKLKKRSHVGIAKYGTMLDRKDLDVRDWLNHIQEELLDGANYIEALLSNLRPVYLVKFNTLGGWHEVTKESYERHQAEGNNKVEIHYAYEGTKSVLPSL